MAIDKETVVRIAKLARLEMDEDALEPMARELDNILAWVEQLDEVDTSGVEPLTSVASITLSTRTDTVAAGVARDELLANAPEADEGFFVVPKVIE